MKKAGILDKGFGAVWTIWIGIVLIFAIMLTLTFLGIVFNAIFITLTQPMGDMQQAAQPRPIVWAYCELIAQERFEENIQSCVGDIIETQTENGYLCECGFWEERELRYELFFVSYDEIGDSK